MNVEMARTRWFRRNVSRILCAVVLSLSGNGLGTALTCYGAAESDADTTGLNQLTSAEQLDGWLLLFDGSTLFGWHAEGKADWQVHEGTIRVTSGDIGLLNTTSSFSDYELKVDFRAPAGTNSGVFLRTDAKAADVTRDAYELNIAPLDNPFPTGSFVKRQKFSPKQEGADQWHTFTVRAERGHFIVHLDGEQVLDYTDPHPIGRGPIGLQHNQGAVEFRNIKLRPLGLKPLFNGKDLSGWKTYPQMASKFTVEAPGVIHVENGRGQLESTEQFGDFVLQYDCQTQGKGLNSGVFFRCMPGLEMMGYECQIHNGYKNGDRTQPEDCGTGGIFRRVNARRVVSDDQQWFRTTLVAEGPHVSVWVNGYHVTDWTDDRKPHENPRKGLRTAAGTLMLQGHDPTTNLSFRHLAAIELPKR